MSQSGIRSALESGTSLTDLLPSAACRSRPSTRPHSPCYAARRAITTCEPTASVVTTSADSTSQTGPASSGSRSEGRQPPTSWGRRAQIRDHVAASSRAAAPWPVVSEARQSRPPGASARAASARTSPGAFGREQVEDVGRDDAVGPAVGDGHPLGRVPELDPGAGAERGDAVARDGHHARAEVDADERCVGRQLAAEQARRERSRAAADLEDRVRVGEASARDERVHGAVLVDALRVLQPPDPVVDPARLLGVEVGHDPDPDRLAWRRRVRCVRLFAWPCPEWWRTSTSTRSSRRSSSSRTRSCGRDR